jgi:hypothetical protein
MSPEPRVSPYNPHKRALMKIEKVRVTNGH